MKSVFLFFFFARAHGAREDLDSRLYKFMMAGILRCACDGFDACIHSTCTHTVASLSLSCVHVLCCFALLFV